MSVASKNPFALLNADVEPASAPPAENPTPVVQAPANQKKSTTSTRRGGGYYNRGGRPQAPVAAPGAEETPVGEKKQYDRGERGERGRGRGRGRGRARGGAGERLDRHSATGVTDTQKKVHQGWGGDRGEAEYKAETQGAADASKESKESKDAWGAPAATEGQPEVWGTPAPAENAEVGWGDGDAKESDAKEDDAKSPDGETKVKKRYDEEEDNKITLDEYLKTKAALVTVLKPEPRKVDADAFKDAVALKKDVDADSYFVGKQPKSGAYKSRTEKPQKQYIEIDAHFERPSRGRGRGEPRGRGEGRGRGRPRAYGEKRQSQTNEFNVEDTEAFPSL